MEGLKRILLAASVLTLTANTAFGQEEEPAPEAEAAPEAHPTVSQVFLCIPGANGLPGSSTVPGFEGCHAAKAVTYSIKNETTATGSGYSVVKPVLSAVEIVRSADEYSPVFFQKAAAGNFFPLATVVQATVDTVDGVVTQTAFSLELGIVVVQKVETVLGDAPVEKISLGSSSVKVVVGAAAACWNKVTNRATCPGN